MIVASASFKSFTGNDAPDNKKSPETAVTAHLIEVTVIYSMLGDNGRRLYPLISSSLS